MVNRKRNYTLYFMLFSVLLLLALSALNYLGMEYRQRMDLTGDKRFTLSEGTRVLLEKLPDNITLTYYVSAEPPDKRVNLERDVREKLEELSRASNGKLTYTVERIDQKSIATRLEDLAKNGVELAKDFQTTDVADKSAAIGVNQYLSTVLVRYGPTQPQAINGIVNVVDPKVDEAAEHRVETLEFDIMYTVMKLKSDQRKPTLKQMLKNMSEPLDIQFLVSEQMPRSNPKLGENIRAALDRLRDYGGEQVKVQSETVPWGERKVVRDPRSGQLAYFPHTNTPEPTVDPKETPEPPAAPPGMPPRPDEHDGDGTSDAPKGTPPGEGVDPRKQPGGITPPGGDEPVKPDEPTKPAAKQGPNFYYTAVVINGQELINDFSSDMNVDAVLSRLEGRIWELVKPRTTLGVVMSEVNGPSPYNDIVSYMFGKLGYNGRAINLRQEKRVPLDLAGLIVFEPHTLSERELYEIDRYLAQGGNVAFLYQAYDADMRIMRAGAPTINLRPLAAQPHFTQWCSRLGITFESDMLIQKGGYELQAVLSSGGRGSQTLPVSLPLAANVGPEDLDQSSIYARGLPGMPLPFPVELKLDDATLSSQGLTRQDVIRLSGEVFRFLPDNRDMPGIPRVGLSFDSRAEVELNSEATPGPDIRLQRLGRQPLICSVLAGTFKSAWQGKDKLVPKWEGPEDKNDIGGQPAPDIKQKPGRLMVMSCAATFNREYFDSWRREDIDPILAGGLGFYRNFADVGLYGDELVNMRAKTGAAPRIRGDISRNERMTWIVLTLGGTPMLLLLLGFMRGAYRAKLRDEYRLKLEQNEAA